MENHNEYIKALVTSGISVIPITEGKKKPHFVCLDENYNHDLLIRRATPEEVEKWVAAGVTSWATAGGPVSENLVIIDFDEKHYLGLYDLWYSKLSDEQKEVVGTFHKSSTRNGGTHLRCRTQTPQPTIKLARKWEWNEKTKKEEAVTTAEIRGEGSYALIPPSVGYTTTQGSLLDLPIISDEMYEELIDILRIFNEVEDEPETEFEWKPRDTPDGDRPGDWLNEKATWNEILEPHGWTEEEKNHWRRPGKDEGEGISATTDYDGRPMFYVFSTSAAPFEEKKGYSKFHVFALLNHKGDFKAAARAAAKMYPEMQSKNESQNADTSVKEDSKTTLLVNLVVGNPEVELFHDEYGVAYASITVNGHKENMACNSKKFKLWLTGEYFDQYDEAPQPSSVSAALATIESNAIFKGKEQKLHNRVARDGDIIWYDLADKQNRAVRITSEGWEIATAPPILFRREAHQLGQNEPVTGGDARKLFNFVNVTNPDQQLLILVHLVSCLIPGFPHPLLYLHGQQGSAKSTFSKIIRMLIDPSRSPVLSFPKDIRELALQLTRHHLIFYENVSWISPAASDLLCIAVTGGSISKRMLYTDADDFFITIQTNVGINGINIAAYQADLLERTILFGLERIEENSNKTEQSIYAEFAKERPKILGALFDAVSKTLALQPSITLKSLPRMADFTQWGATIAEALGSTKEEFLRIYQSKIREQSDEAIDTSTEANALLRFMEGIEEPEWSGEPAQLLAELKKTVNSNDSEFAYGEELPKKANKLMRRLNILKPNLRMAGLEVFSGKKERVNGRRRVVIRKVSQKIVQSVPDVHLPQQDGGITDDIKDDTAHNIPVSSANIDTDKRPKDNEDGVGDTNPGTAPFEEIPF